MMKYKGYVGKVEFDPDAGILHGEVVGIRDVVTFQGLSVAEVEHAFRDSVDDYLAFCKERGEKPEKACSGKLVVRIGSDLHRSAALLAGMTGKSLNGIIAECLQSKVDSELPATRSSLVRGRRKLRARSPRKRGPGSARPRQLSL
jgi:predicted HicB family RNase H-like nuclease